MLLHIVFLLVILIYLMIMMALKKKAEKKKTKKYLESLETPDNNTDLENLAEVVIQNVPDPTAGSEEPTLTRTLPPTPMGMGMGKGATPCKKPD